jgi:hypothetical protein
MTAILALAKRLASEVDGIDWNAQAVNLTTRAILATLEDASPPEIGSAFQVLIERLKKASLQDADGVAHVAITAGTLVEHGADPAALASSLQPLLLELLGAARRYADTCLRGVAEFESDEHEEQARENALLEVDNTPVSREQFRAHLDSDRPGACALAYLKQWTLPTVAALTRHRLSLLAFRSNLRMVGAARALRHSDAYWLFALLTCELESQWLVLCPSHSRGFELVLDGIAVNFSLHELVSDALVRHGVPGASNSPDMLEYLRGECETRPNSPVLGSFNFYDYRAAAFDLNAPHDVPHDSWVWNEGVPDDIPHYGPQRVLLVGPPAYERTWNAGRPFSNLKSSARVVRELTSAEFDAWMARLTSR